jgi:hypothetical protein
MQTNEIRNLKKVNELLTMDHWARSMLASEPTNKGGAWGFVQHDRLTRRGVVKGSDLFFTVSGMNSRRFGSPNLLGLCEDVGWATRHDSAMGNRDLTSPGDDLIGWFGAPTRGVRGVGSVTTLAGDTEHERGNLRQTTVKPIVILR